MMSFNRLIFNVLFASLCCLGLFLPSFAFGQERIFITWKEDFYFDSVSRVNIPQLTFENAYENNQWPKIPVFKRRLVPPSPGLVAKVAIKGTIAKDLIGTNFFSSINLPDSFYCVTVPGIANHLSFTDVFVVPVRYNQQLGYPQILESFELSIEWISPSKSIKSHTYATNSVLATGNWYRFGIQKSGVVKITYSDIQSWGFSLAGVDPKKLRVFGQGGGPLPEANSTDRPDDLLENAIEVVDGGDGSFDANDYILFYALGPESWEFNSRYKKFIRKANPYSTTAYYFFTISDQDGKRVSIGDTPTQSPSKSYSNFIDYTSHEVNLYNLIGSGRTWVGEAFDYTTKQEFSTGIVDMVTPSTIRLASSITARSCYSQYFDVSFGSTRLLRQSPSPISCNSTSLLKIYGTSRLDTTSAKFTSNFDKFTYEYFSSSGTGWLNYFEINYERNLKFPGGFMAFRVPSSVKTGQISRFEISNANSDLRVWDITDVNNAEALTFSLNGSVLNFNAETSELKEFVVFSTSNLLSPIAAGRVENQNLHGMAKVDYIMISYPGFISEANRLADFHRSKGLTVAVLTPQQIYNEFSSGAQDVTAIRDFFRMLYKRSDSGDHPKYCLMVGDASYDYLDILSNNSNFVPTWETAEYLNPDGSIASDDYFALLDDSEGFIGDNLTGYIDIGFGRLPVKTLEQTRQMVDKIIGYATPSDSRMKPWRNMLTVVADDQDNNTHLNQAESLSSFIKTSFNIFNQDKIYFDAYPQISASGGQRYPEVNAAINRKISSGTILINYVGHGGELGWGHERVLEIADITAWRNADALAFFITATCEFSRYDDPTRVSAGEEVILNPLGGGIGLFTTSRVTYSGANDRTNKAFVKWLLTPTNSGRYNTLGETVWKAKAELGAGDGNTTRFILLGDPALTLAFPMNKVETTAINGNSVDGPIDTLSALQPVTIEGKVVSETGALLSDFNGTCFVSVYDKESVVNTLGQDYNSIATSFNVQKNILYNGVAEVKNGLFSVSFIVPYDIAFNFGKGRISYYARNDEIDANGLFENVIIGGISNDANEDNTPPLITLHMNDEEFRNGGLTGPNPVLLAKLYDESGINSSGNGIGHDLTAVLDGETSTAYILNDFYLADKGTYKSGSLSYQLYNLAEGDHTLKVTAWDVFNNSASKAISFKVGSADQPQSENITCYPNPFYSQCRFDIEHNLAGQTVEVTIDIFDMIGKKIRRIQETQVPVGNHLNPIYFDGENEGGSALGAGLYLYKITLTTTDGNSVEKTGKLVKTNVPVE